MRVVITGAGGQLGRACQNAFSHHELIVWSRAEADISDPAVSHQVAAAKPDLVINAAAWTDVDGAERDPAGAYAANALGPLHLAQACTHCGSALVQISTNEVFAGQPGRCYREYDQPQPINQYARSKLAGEAAARQLLDRLYIVRVAWLFGPGGTHFPAKILQAADRLGALKVVHDEMGNPTYAPDVAAALVQLVETGRYGIYHLVNQGQASRFDFAQAVLRESGRSHIPLTPIAQKEWPRPAVAPTHAVLVNQAAAALGIVLRPWPEALATYLQAAGITAGPAVPSARLTQDPDHHERPSA